MLCGCRGVVQLFNAISKAQAAKRQADAAGVKRKDVVKTTKAALLGALQPEAKASGVLSPLPDPRCVGLSDNLSCPAERRCWAGLLDALCWGWGLLLWW